MVVTKTAEGFVGTRFDARQGRQVSALFADEVSARRAVGLVVDYAAAQMRAAHARAYLARYGAEGVDAAEQRAALRKADAEIARLAPVQLTAWA